MFAQSRRGNDSLGVRAPGFIPQSTKTLLSGVVNNIHDLPTWPKPPIVFEVFNSFVWTASVILIYRSSKVLFENNTVVPILTALFFLQPSLLMSSTQLLRDPFQILGLCFLCYGWVLIAKTELHLRAILYIEIGRASCRERV